MNNLLKCTRIELKKIFLTCSSNKIESEDVNNHFRGRLDVLL